ncbi:MAG: hypothetical protein HYX27_09105 [Acidobacteria bacterium]|nr:hypothetical protein [Acidobacteriota bacterium]
MRFAALLAAPAAQATPNQEGRTYSCQYRARATVLLLSVPLLHRDNVGSGYFRAVESEGSGKRHLRLEFGAGSLPDRAAGLNRLGVFEETIVESGDSIESALYFGFMTASNEKDLTEARAALHGSGTVSFTAIRGRIERGRVSNHLLRIRDLPATEWGQREKLMADIRARFASSSDLHGHASTSPSDEPCSPFLYAVSRAMRNKAASWTARFVHNGQMHRLKTTRKSNGEPGVAELEGRIQNDTGKELSSFRLWFETDRAERGPIRFEFRPRSFLRLTFERV